jgi:YbbR domain-containing protein
VYVTDRDDDERTARVPGAVPITCVNLPSDKAVASACSDQSVVVRVRARDSVIDNLTGADFTASADLSAVTSDTETVSVIVDSQRSGVDIIDVSPPQITVHLEDLIIRQVPVGTHLVGAPLRGFEIATVGLQPTEAVVSGPQSLVDRVAAVEVDIDLTGVRTNLSETLLLHARDDRGGDIRNVVVDPESATVEVELRQLLFSAPFVVQPNVTGAPATGFVVSGVQIEPPFVTVSGPADIFQSLDPSGGISTEPISIDGATADVVRPAVLRLPQGATVEQPAVTVRVIITRFSPGGTPASPRAP